MKVILIAGGAASGKTSLAEKLRDTLRAAGKTAELIVMDSYYKEIPADREINDYRANTNFDRVTMFELEALKQDIIELSQERHIPKYQFVYTTNKRHSIGQIVPPEFLIVEGLFTMHLKRKLPTNLSVLTVFVEVSSYLTLVDRRVARDLLNRGREREETIRHERKFVGVAYFHNIASGMRGIDLTVVNDPFETPDPHPLEKGIDDIFASLGLTRPAPSIHPAPKEEVVEELAFNSQNFG